MENWVETWRKGIAPLLSDKSLDVLLTALVKDDQCLIQGQITSRMLPILPVEAACAIGYVGWKGEGLKRVGEVNDFFGQICFQADELLNETCGGVRWFLSWFDDTPRDEMRLRLIPEIQREQARREGREVGRKAMLNHTNRRAKRNGFAPETVVTKVGA
mgnify:CR=1 FL=1